MAYVDKLYDYVTSEEIIKIYDGLSAETIKIYDGLSATDACLHDTFALIQLIINAIGINGFVDIGCEDIPYPFATYSIYSYNRINQYLSQYIVRISLYSNDMQDAIVKAELTESSLERIDCIQKVAASGINGDKDRYVIDMFYKFNCY